VTSSIFPMVNVYFCWRYARLFLEVFCNDNLYSPRDCFIILICFIICVLSFRCLNDFTLVNVVLYLFEYLILVCLSIYFPNFKYNNERSLLG
jgi:hypothetical protein